MMTLITACLLYGCDYHFDKPLGAYDPKHIKFMDVAEQVLAPKCLSCHHSGKMHDGKPMLDLMIYAEVRSRVVPGQPMKSKLFKMIYVDEMPPEKDGKPPCTDEQKQMVFDWIMQGAVEK